MRKDELRPQILEDYIGQEHIKDLLRVSMLAAKGRGDPLDHVLLNGPPGLGKTTLALIIGNEMGWRLKTIIGPSVGGPHQVSRLVQMLPKNYILFIDEIHRVRKPSQEVFYPVLEDNKLQSTLNPEVEIEIHPLTIIGATTNLGRLERPFIDRFGLQFQLNYYTVDELSEIIWASADKLKLRLDHSSVEVIARRSRGTPRIANNFLKRLRDYSAVHEEELTAPFVTSIIETRLHTDDLGLRPLDHRYLEALLGQDNGLGIEAIASRINEEVETTEDFIEPYLVSLGLVERRPNGRCLTTEGQRFVERKLKTSAV